MANDKYGIVNWDEPKFGKQQQYSNDSKNDFLYLKNGDNYVRLVTPPFQFSQWRFKPLEIPPEGRNKYGERVNSSLFHGKAPLQEEPWTKNEWHPKWPSRRWLCGVIDRATGAYKVLDIGTTVFEQIQYLNNKRGDVMGYDLCITKDSNKPAASMYKVIDERPTPLSAADLEIKANVDMEELKKRVTPPTYDEVKSRVAKIVEQWTTKTDSAAAATSKGGDNDNFDFPAATDSDK